MFLIGMDRLYKRLDVILDVSYKQIASTTPDPQVVTQHMDEHLKRLAHEVAQHLEPMKFNLAITSIVIFCKRAP